MLRCRASRDFSQLLRLFGLLIAGSMIAQFGLSASALAQSKLPTVKIFATGGTIANTPDGRIAVEAILQALPEVGKIANIKVEDITRKGSAQLTWVEFIATAKAIERTLEKEPDVDGIMVTVGSNSSEDLAYFLNLVIKTKKPLVLTAAQRQRTTRSEDASRNFIDAVRTAAAPETGGKGAVLVANELIHAARDVTKNVYSRVDTWQSLDIGALGIISAGQVAYYRTPTRRHTEASEFTLAKISQPSDLPAVEVIYSYVDANPGMIDAAVKLGAKGLVVAGFATGSPHGGQRPVLEAAAKNGIPIVIGNRGHSGRVAGRAAPYISADTLTPQKAVTLLRLALSVTKDPVKIQEIFHTY